MEPFPKRQRLHAPIERSFPQSFDNQYAYYDELGDDLLDGEVYGEEEEEEPEAGYDPEAELDQRRARLDYKLKSTFESIFEKYERDFEGVGDEIDLETGEIVVNNGHVVQMVNEHDAGDMNRARHALREYSQEADEPPSSSFDETEIMEDDDENDEEEDELVSDNEILDEDMAEDDLILRGFAKANRFQQGPQELSLSNVPTAPEKIHRREKVHQNQPIPRPAPAKSLPSRADILAQFGPQLGPQIVEYVSLQNVADDRDVESAWRAPELKKNLAATRNIEPAWRTPALPSAAPRHVESAWRVPELPATTHARRPIQKPILIMPEEERSPSPEASASIWAPIRTRGRRRLDGADNTALFRGESRVPNPVAYQSSRFATHQADLVSPMKKRLAFTAEEDDVLMEWVSKSRRHGRALTHRRWKELEAQHPRHSALSWRARYIRNFTYLSLNSVEESDRSNSEGSVENLGYRPLLAVKRTEPQYDSDQAPHDRPIRARRPAQTDPRILNWNQAIDSIESVDPVLHAGITEDVKRANRGPLQYSHRRHEPRLESDIDTPIQSQETTPPAEIRHSYDDLPIRSSLAVEATSEEEDFLIPGAPCPHVDCKTQSTILYRLQRREHEDLSEMCLHLFQAHHTTPFPCGEIGCSKKGEDGYFMQLDLVKHVRRTHKNASALYRLRGRIDPALLDPQAAIARPTVTSDPLQRPLSRRRDSDFLSPQKGQARNLSSSQPAGFDPDRTLTPRGMAGLNFTPMTSVSSMKVHHHSATSLGVRDIDTSQDRTISDSQVGSSQILSSQPRKETTMHSGSLVQEAQGFSQIANQRRVNSDPIVQSEESSRRHFEPASGRPVGALKTPSPVIPAGILTSAIVDLTSPTTGNQKHIEPDITKQDFMRSQSQVTILPASKPVVEEAAFKGESSTVSRVVTTTALPKHPPINSSMFRSTVNAAYEFSDEEQEMQSPKTVPVHQFHTPRHGPKQRAKVPIVPASVSSRFAVVIPTPKPFVEPPIGGRIGALKAVAKPVATPGCQIKPPATIAPLSGPSSTRPKATVKLAATPAAKRHARVRSEDLDELSLGVDEFILLSSRQRTNPLPIRQIGIKHEDLVSSPALLSVPATRKRKLDAIHDHSIDELSAFNQLSKNGLFQPTIKTETDEPSLPAMRPIMPKRKGRPSTVLGVVESSSSQEGSSRASELMQTITSTPLLDLTPVRNARIKAERMKEIGDSETEEDEDPDSPTHRPRQRPREQTARPVISGNNSSVTMSRWNRDSLKAKQVSVLVKTPGGTMRRCGVDGFECKRSFCFRCEKRTLEQVV
ncbi:hypothetical protein WAI453_011490 [Rhynchosporium graminicola]